MATPAGSQALARSALYRLLADSFAFPNAEFFERVKDGGYYDALRASLSAVARGRCAARLASLREKLGGCDSDFDEFCSEYIRLFDVSNGDGKPPCTLYGGEYATRARLDVMEELIRFYGFFDLAPSDRERELPDHASVELEFLHYLAFRESLALEAGTDAGSFRRAQADFIARHPGHWMPLMHARLESQAPLPFFDGLVVLATEVLRADLEYLNSLLAP